MLALEVLQSFPSHGNICCQLSGASILLSLRLSLGSCRDTAEVTTKNIWIAGSSPLAIREGSLLVFNFVDDDFRLVVRFGVLVCVWMEGRCFQVERKIMK